MSLEIVNILTKLSKTDMNNSINHIIKSMDSNITDADISKICNIMKSNMSMINDAIESKNNLNFDSSGFMQYIKKLDCSNQSGGSNKKTKKYNYYIIIPIIIIVFGIVVMIIKGKKTSKGLTEFYKIPSRPTDSASSLICAAAGSCMQSRSLTTNDMIERAPRRMMGSSDVHTESHRQALATEGESFSRHDYNLYALTSPSHIVNGGVVVGGRFIPSHHHGGGLDTNKILTIIAVIIAKYFSQQKTTINTIESIPITFEISKINDIYTILYMINLYGLNSFQNIII